MCRNDWKNNKTGFNDNEFCLDCYTSQDYIHLTIADYCKRIETPNWWCIQLKCATWEPYPDGPGKIDCDMNRSIYAY